MAFFTRIGKGGNDAGKRPERGGGRERPPRRYDDTEYEYEDRRDEESEPPIPDEDWAECERNQVLRYLRMIEDHRGQWQYATAELQRIVQDSAELTETWNQFQAAGGVTADDFFAFINGKWRVRRTHGRRHLRLLVSNGRRPVRLRVHRNGDDDAA
jgi:hypothetical protein